MLSGSNLAQYPLPSSAHYGLQPCDDGLWTLVVVHSWVHDGDRRSWETASGAIEHPPWTWHLPVPVSGAQGAPNWPGHFASHEVQGGDTKGQAMRKISRNWPWFDA